MPSTTPTARAQLAFAAAAVRAQLRQLPAATRAHLRARHGADPASVTLADPPDGALARTALELARDSSASWLLHHSLRCWLWADLLATTTRERVGYDPELLYVACVLHDIGLSDDHRPTGHAACFAVHGGEVARATALAAGAEAAFAQRIADAIAAHMNVRVPLATGPEAHLLHAAAHLDVAGTRADQLDGAQILAVLRRHPRGDFALRFADAMRREAVERPGSRAAVLWRSGMRIAIAANPLDRYRDETR
ncbi:HD domain-containing protein [Patulibacter defluvii]|uniref:HD domain-containing protein n=1 Tax=Patulibacter defluvii TaxID=3095358 RepID=UPI002A74BA34|nr:HD domain-containing protein [Patulibacter sp. DM4]